MLSVNDWCMNVSNQSSQREWDKYHETLEESVEFRHMSLSKFKLSLLEAHKF